MEKEQEYLFLIYDVSKDEFERIKNCQDDFLERISKYNEGINFSVRYNEKRGAVGITLTKDKKEQLLLYGFPRLNELGDDINTHEAQLARNIRKGLVEKLDLIRIKEEAWVE